MDWCRTGSLNLAARLFSVSTAHAAPRGEALSKKAEASYDDYEFDKAAAYCEDADADPVGGSLFLTAELGLIGANVALAVLDSNARAQDASAPTAQLERDITISYAVRTASGIAAIVMGAFGILDAFVWSPGRGEARHKKRYSLMNTPLPSGGAFAASLTF